MGNRTEAATQAIGAFIATMTRARALVVSGSLNPELYGRLLHAEDLLDIVDERLLRLSHTHAAFAAAPALRRRLKRVCADTRRLARM
jgi:hypothetical protein